MIDALFRHAREYPYYFLATLFRGVFSYSANGRNTINLARPCAALLLGRHYFIVVSFRSNGRRMALIAM